VTAATTRTLSRRALNRTLLGRQLLLERAERAPADVVEHLVGLQAQVPIDPYVALWTRIDGFDPLELSGMLEGRRAVRTGYLRGTLHLVSARDMLAHYPLVADIGARSWKSTQFSKQLAGIDIDAVVAAARATLEERPQTTSELGAALAQLWPDRESTALAYAARYLLPLVQVPPRGLWGRTGRPTNTTAETWLGSPMAEHASIEDLLLRYLAAFGPATVGDMRVWSWLTGLREVVDRLRPRLRTFRDDAGRELFDVLDGPIVDEGVPAPIRFLPQYDNVFLSHEDRSRILSPTITIAELIWRGGVLVDGFVGAAWRMERVKRQATMTVTRYVRVDVAQQAAMEQEADRLLRFLAADAEEREIAFADA
jgi:Winged helix DNA-binding domain